MELWPSPVKIRMLIRRGYVIAAYIIHECATRFAYKIKLSVTHFEVPKSVVVNMRLLM